MRTAKMDSVHPDRKGNTPVNDALRTRITRYEKGLRTFFKKTSANVRKFYHEKILGQTAEREAAGNIVELDDEPVDPDRTPETARPAKARTKPIRRRSRQKVYRLKGYTTVAKINHKRQSERQQRFLRQLLVLLICILLLFLLFQLYNPIKDLSEWYRIIGIRDISDLTRESTTDSSDSDPSGNMTSEQTSMPLVTSTEETTRTD
jgi:hypothetical protein